MKLHTTIEIEEEEIEVSVDFTIIPGDPGLYAYSNGDPGYPPTSDEVDFLSPVVDANGKEYEPTSKEWDRIIDECLEFAADYDNDNY